MPSRPEVPAIRVALVNNMPDSAFAATESQFGRLLDESKGGLRISLSRYWISSIERGPEVRSRAAERYQPVEQLYRVGADAVIITGSEPKTDDIQDESYWHDLTSLLHWALSETRSVVLSCLAAHAAALDLDGISRSPLASKLSGAFSQQLLPDHPLSRGLDLPVVIPHSRHNEIAMPALRQAGYEVLLSSCGEPYSGWTLAAKDVGGCMLMLVQGHPEYDADSLLREYRRDVLRYIRRDRLEFPELPEGYLGAEEEAVLLAFESRVRSSHPADAFLAEHFPFHRVAARLGWPWRSCALEMYANWLSELAGMALGTEVTKAPGPPWSSLRPEATASA